MKKALSLVLSMLLLCGVLSPCAFAADTATTPGTATLTFERTGGAIANVLGQLLKVITLSDESRIKKGEWLGVQFPKNFTEEVSFFVEYKDYPLFDVIVIHLTDKGGGYEDEY